MAFRDFNLHIWRDGERYLAAVTASPAGTTHPVVLRWPFGTEPHELLLLRLENAILKGRGYRGIGPLSSEERILREFGAEVFKAVFRDADPVWRKFIASFSPDHPNVGLRVNLRADPPELAMLPWEYVFDESYLCLRKESPLVRFLGPGPGNPVHKRPGPIRILGMVSNPGGEWNTLDAEAERHRIDDALRDAVRRGLVDFRWVERGTPDELFVLVQQGPWDIFHFIGHGGTERYVTDTADVRVEGFVVMEDGLGEPVKVSASELAVILEDAKVQLAVLNCCESGRGEQLSSVGATLVDRIVPMAIAMQFAITDASAARFAEMFYQQLVQGKTVEHALTVARNFVRLRSHVEWAIPVLFSRAGPSALFDTEADQGKHTSQPGAPRQRDHVAATPPQAHAVPDTVARARDELRRLWERRS